MKNYRGSNQYKTHYRLVAPETRASIWFVAFVTALLIPAVQGKTISPCPQEGCAVKVVYAQEAVSETQEVINQIVKEFQDEPVSVLNDALNVAYCESRYKKSAYNYNTNGTGDYSIFQINSVHTKTYGDGYYYNYVENIKVAHQIYKSHGNWSAWVCAKYL